MKAQTASALAVAACLALPAPAASRFIIVKNGHDHATVWVTSYRNDIVTRTISKADCVPPGQERAFPDTGSVVLVGELTQGRDCQHPVACKIGVTVDDKSWGNRTAVMEFRANAQKCWWDPLYHQRR